MANSNRLFCLLEFFFFLAQLTMCLSRRIVFLLCSELLSDKAVTQILLRQKMQKSTSWLLKTPVCKGSKHKPSSPCTHTLQARKQNLTEQEEAEQVIFVKFYFILFLIDNNYVHCMGYHVMFDICLHCGLLTSGSSAYMSALVFIISLQ